MGWGVTLLATLSISGTVTPYARMPYDVYSGWYDDYSNCYHAALDYNAAGREEWPHRLFGCIQQPIESAE